MSALRRIVTVLVMVYLLLILLFVLTSGARDAMLGIFGGSVQDFWFTMSLIGAGLLLLQLLVENAYTATLRRDATRHEGKVNELKAKLYDYQMDQRDRDGRTGGTTVPRPAQPTPVPQPAPNTIPRTTAYPPVQPVPSADPNPPHTVTTVPPPSAADLPPTVVNPNTPPPYPNDRPAV